MSSTSITHSSGIMTIFTDNRVEIWQIPTANAENELDLLFEYLSPDERVRANNIYSNEKKRTYITSHAATRVILGNLLGTAPQKIDIQTGSHGKPVIGSSNIQFNLSHTQSLSLLGISMQNNVGIDIETIKPAREFLAIAKRFFNPSEYAWLKDLEQNELPGYFYQLWCFKEAYLKGTGTGLQGGLENLSLSKEDLKLDKFFSPLKDSSWQVMPLYISNGYKAALALENESHMINMHCWHGPEYNPEQT